MDEEALQQLAARLAPAMTEASVRGTGKARFLYVTNREKAAEVSWTGTQWWVEFWDALDAEPAAEALFDSIEEVEAALTQRLA